MSALCACGGGGDSPPGEPDAAVAAAVDAAPPPIERGWIDLGRAEQTSDSLRAVNPSLVVDAAGGITIVWRRLGFGTGTSVGTLWGTHYATGSGWGTAVLLQADSVWNNAQPILVGDAAGDAAAIWLQDGGDASPEPRVLWARCHVAGVGWIGATRLEHEAGTVDEPVAWLDAEQRVQVAWRLYRHGGFRLRTARFDPATGWSAATDLPGTGADASGLLAVSASATGDLVAIWRTVDADRVASLWANRYAHGQGWGTPVALEDGASSVFEPSLSTNERGDALVVWLQRQGTDGGIVVSVWANHFTVGAGWSGATVLEHDDAHASSPRGSLDATGRAMALWTQGDPPWAARLWTASLDGASGWSQPEAVTAGDGARNPGLGVDDQGVATVAWSDARSAVWTRRFVPTSGWGDPTLHADNDHVPAEPRVAVSRGGVVALAFRRDHWHLGVARYVP